MYKRQGDTHRSFGHIKNFCKNNNTSKEDILIILGDAGINYYGDPYDMDIKKYINQLDITLFCVHGNHENRPNNIGSYLEKSWHGGIVFYEKEFPTILFPKDGEIFDICGSKVLVIGGAYSIDKFFRICNNMKLSLIHICPPYANCSRKDMCIGSMFLIKYCPECGRPLTEEAWRELAERLGMYK